MNILHQAGSVLVPDAPLTASDLIAACQSGEFRVVVAQLGDTFDNALLERAAITGISNYAVGVNNIDVASATRRSIIVGNTPGVLTDATADIAMLLILGVARRCVEADQYLRAGSSPVGNQNYCSATTSVERPSVWLASGVSPVLLRGAPWPSGWTWRFVPALRVTGTSMTTNWESSRAECGI
jgi:lactate dehydrogenase-like 2-hydroxyacid dehydrogenase